MQRIWTTDLAGHVGERVYLAGWLHRLRRLGNVSFLVLRDARGLAQVVIEDPALAARLSQMYNESVIEVRGLAVAEAQAPGGVEVRDPSVELVSPALDPPPFDLFRPALKAQLPTILDHAPLALRHPPYRALFEVASASMAGFRAALRSMDFVEVQTPKIVASATESGANVFPIDYFGRTAYLAQSPQFYKQIMVGVFERVFEVGPVFRAEPHDTPRHLNEYVSLDAELGFIDGPQSVMQALVQAIGGMVEAVREEAAQAVALLGIDLPDVPVPVPSIHFPDAQELIFRETGEDVRGEPDLAPADERCLGDWARREHGSEFLFVTGFPMSKRPICTLSDTFW